MTARLKDHARRLGFTLAGACPAVSATGFPRLKEWLERGYAGQMDYIPDRLTAYEHPRGVLEGCRSILMLAMEYRTADPHVPQQGQGRISRYAWSTADYHDVIHERLRRLVAAMHELVPGAKARGVVDTAPLLEREFAQLAGLGWIGKNTLLLNKLHGSYFFLAALLTDQELGYDEPFAADHCGTCTACLSACPTQAFPQPYVLDATKCISYLTIELRDAIPAELRPRIGDWLFGCDVCQEVCPWNARRSPRSEVQASKSDCKTREDTSATLDVGCGPLDSFQPSPDSNPIDLIPLFDLDDDAFRARFRHTPLWRAKRRGILRNAAVILGNQQCREAIPALTRGASDPEPVVREACQWALAQFDPARPLGRKV